MDISRILIILIIMAGLIRQIIYLQKSNVFNNQILGVISKLFFTITVFILTIYYSIVILYPEAGQILGFMYFPHLFCIVLYASNSYIAKFQAASELLTELNINNDPNVEACIDRYKEDAAKYPSTTLTFLKISTFILSILYIISYTVVFDATTAEVANKNKNNILFEKSEQKNNEVLNNLDIDAQKKQELPIKDAEVAKLFINDAQKTSMLNANLLADRRFFYISISCIFLMVFMIVLVHGDYSYNSSAFGYIDAHYAEFIADRAKKMLNSKDLNKYDMHIGDGSITQALVFLGVHLFALMVSLNIFS